MQLSAKEIASLLRSLSRTANEPHFTSAIIAAAGRGTRMQAADGSTKQMMELCGMPVIVRTLKAFEACPMVNEIIVVALEDELPIYKRYKKEYGLTKISAVVAGGDTRQDSVLKGFEAISDKADFVAIHDGARCLITPEQIEANAWKLLEQVGLSDKLENYPYQLSGGQQQRVAIARALALQPEVLCFDEPTSALDPELTGEVLRVIRGLKSGDNTMIVVTHEMEFARNVADIVIYMADGVIEEIGTPEEVFDHPTSEKTKAFLHGAAEKF